MNIANSANEIILDLDPPISLKLFIVRAQEKWNEEVASD